MLALTSNSHYSRPFWLVTLISGLLALLSILVLLSLYRPTGQWQYLALTGLAGLIVLAHGLGWWLARTRGRADLGIWLIGGAQIVSALLTPLFMADYWFIGLVLLMVAPLEVGLADQLRRIPLFVVFSFVGAAGMLIIDLQATSSRLAILSDFPFVRWLAVSLLSFQLGALLVLLWYFRLRRGAEYRIHFDLATQQSLVFTVISAGSILIVTGVLIAEIRNSQIQQVGQNFETLARINAERVGNSLELQIDALLALGRRSTSLQEALIAANAAYPASDVEVQRLLKVRAGRWQTSPETSEFVLDYRSNPQTIELSKFRGSDLLHNNVFLTDRYGGLVAAQGAKPKDFFFGDQPWWQAAWDNGQGGIFLGLLQVDAPAHTASVFIAVGVLDPETNQTIGVLASTYQLNAVQQDVRRINNQITGELIVLVPEQVLIAGPDQELIGQRVESSKFAADLALGDPATQAAWLLGVNRQVEPAVLAYAPLNTTSGVKIDALRALNWLVVVSDTQAHALAEVTRSTKIASLVAVLVMTLVVLVATIVTRLITRPIEALTAAAAAINEGNLEQYAEPVGPVELVTLAETFNGLTTRLRMLINNLQEQVEERTAQLAEATREAQEARIAAEAANEAKSAFLASVSHELRTPLTSVLGFAKIVERQLHAQIFPHVQSDERKTRRAMEAVTEDIRIIVIEGERLTKLINDVLDLAKIEAGKVDWQMEVLDISAVVERATSATSGLFESKDRLKLVKEIEPNLPEIIGDRDRLIQVIINLISNAVKFTEQGLVTCYAGQRNGEIVVRVTDTGIGIPQADQNRIFERFVQAGDTLTDKPKGTGLGLPISKEIIEYHGGRIWVESQLGQGSTFAFTVPIRE